MNNEQRFFKELLALEHIEYSPQLSKQEIVQIFWDVVHGNYPDPVIEFARRIEYAHLIGVKNARSKAWWCNMRLYVRSIRGGAMFGIKIGGFPVS